MSLRSTCLAAVLSAGALALLPSVVDAMSYVMPSDDALLAQADGVLVATVEAPVLAKSTDLSAGGYTVRIERALAGPALMGVHRLALPPSIENGVDQTTHGLPRLAPGERLLVLYRQGADGSLRPVQLSLGLFMAGTAESGAAAWLRGLDDANNVDAEHNAEYHRMRDAARFERWLTAAAAGLAPKRDYLLTEPATRSAALPKYTLMSTPFRWFQFDSSTSVPWHITSTGIAGVTFDEPGETKRALAAWNDDSNSRILLAYAGTTSSDAGTARTDGKNTIMWDDPGNDIAGSFDCNSGGVLAIGGAYFSGSTGSVGGVTYRKAVEGYVMTQNGAGCWYARNGGTNGAEVLTHEIGHTLGFGHSCGDSGSPACSTSTTLNQATMRAQAHGDGRGAVLGSDDRAVAYKVYPAPAGATPTTTVIHSSGFERR